VNVRIASGVETLFGEKTAADVRYSVSGTPYISTNSETTNAA
jgi:hypothetical protein